MYADVLIGEELLEKKSVYSNFDDRDLGTILLGATGKGKTSLMEHLIAKDIANRTTAIIFDPHGEMSERLLRIGSAIRPGNLLFCEIGNNLSYGFNPLEVQNPGDPLEESQTIDSLMQVFRKHWSDNPAYSFGSRVEWVLSNTARTILANPGYTLAEIPLLLHDKTFRDKLVRNVVNPQVQFFWGEYRQLESTRRPLDTWQMVESTITRLTQFLANEWLYRVLYQAKGTIKFHELIDSGKTIIFSLPIGKLGEEPASLLGSLLLGKLATTIFGRNEYGKQYPRVHIYIDEYARFSIPLISQLWVQARKFNCGLTATIQTLSQIKDEESRAAILQAGNLIAFQCIGSDAQIIAQQMPLPDPVSLMKPEPIVIYSQSAIEDILEHGHPNEFVRQVSNFYFKIFKTIMESRQQEFVEYPFFTGRYSKSGIEAWTTDVPGWFLAGYRSHREEVKDAQAALNEYFLRSMQHEFYDPHPAIWQQQLELMFEVILCLEGSLGIHKAYQEVPKEAWQAYLQTRGANPRTAISPRDVEQSYGWEATQELDEDTALAYTKTVNSCLALMGKNIEESPQAVADQDKYRELKLAYYRVNHVFDKHLSCPPDLREVIYWEGANLFSFTTNLSRCGYLLQKEPVYSRSAAYKDVEYNRRTYSDLREELVTKLVSLPAFQAICSLATKAGELPIQIATPPPLTIDKFAEEKAKAVREESRKKLGHPWQEVVRDIQERQNLPPAKPQI
jgi:Helicase HerA, central domain